MIILKDKSLFEATELAEKLRNIIENHTFCYVDRITSSFGISSFQQNDIPDTLIKRADQALYMAKKSGRNTIQTL
ncbi:MAG: diguanylate cyclase [Lysinibacillus sp.]|nr:diguanylate cyclase [Lysinibacillus sp.]